jgi:DNA-binding NarL/FixJ family response regulator
MNRILIVEDDTLLLGALETFLKLHDFQVSTTDNVKDAMGLIDSFKPHLVVCDLMLSESSGFTFLHWVRSRPDCDRIAFIILTAQTEQKTVRVAMGSGADDYLTKPVTSEDLLTAIKSRLARMPREVDVTAKSDPRTLDSSDSSTVASGDPAPTNRWNLSKRERESLKWLISGKSNEEISKIMGIAVGTLKRHNFSIFSKLGVETRTAAVVAVLTNPTLSRLLDEIPDSDDNPEDESVA